MSKLFKRITSDEFSKYSNGDNTIIHSTNSRVYGELDLITGKKYLSWGCSGRSSSRM